MRVGCIGLGTMGARMAARLAATGALAGVWNRTREQAEAFVGAHGAAVAESPAALARMADLLLISVSADADVTEVIEALLPALSATHLLVDTSTIGVDTAAALAARVAETGAAWLDAPVSGGMEGAASGQLAMFVGGSAAALERARPTLAQLATRIVHLGAAGAGQAGKAVNQVMAAGINQAVSEALAFATALELPMERLLPLLAGGAAGNWFLERRGASMTAGRYEPGFKLALHHKDLALCRTLAQSLGATLPLVEMTLIHYGRLLAAGHGEEDISALYRLKQQLFATAAPN